MEQMSVTYFNTSHVNVNRRIVYLKRGLYTNFNTSHVNVNRKEFLNYSFKHNISIHLMLMLIEDFMHNIR